MFQCFSATARHAVATVLALATLATQAAEPIPAPAPAVAQAPAPAAAPVPAAPLPAGSSCDDQARFLAGLPVSAGSPLAALQENADYKEFATALDAEWKVLAERLDKVSTWQQAELAPRIQGGRKVIYFFGGPDAAHAVRLFPDAPAFLLAGLEPVGVVEAPEKMKFADVHTAIDGLSFGLRTFVVKSFFRTSEMGKDLQGRGIRGVLPVLYLMLSRSGAHIVETGYFEVDAAGVAKDKAAGEKWGPGIPGVRVRFQLPGKPVQEMDYVRVDLLDENLVKQPGFLTWARTWGPANGFLKAASFILHDKAFSRPRALLLETCATVLEDDSGIPLRAFKKGEWEETCFGTYMRPRDPFERQFQPELDALCKAQPARPLSFIIGYRRQNDTFLLLAARKSAEAAPLAPAPVPALVPGQGSQPAAGAVPAAPLPASPAPR